MDTKDLPVRFLRERVAVKDARIVRDAAGGVREEPVPAALRRKRVLRRRELRGLCAAGARVRALLGKPGDVEFAVEGSATLWLLQMRAITTTTERAPTRPWRAGGDDNLGLWELEPHFPRPLPPTNAALLPEIMSASVTTEVRKAGQVLDCLNVAVVNGLARRAGVRFVGSGGAAAATRRVL